MQGKAGGIVRQHAGEHAAGAQFGKGVLQRQSAQARAVAARGVGRGVKAPFVNAAIAATERSVAQRLAAGAVNEHGKIGIGERAGKPLLMVRPRDFAVVEHKTADIGVVAPAVE